MKISFATWLLWLTVIAILMTSICEAEESNRVEDRKGKDAEDVSVGLVGWDNHSGTVTVTFDGSTGLICDGEWHLKKAHVVCKMLGYRGAVASVRQNAFDYPPEKAVFMLDDVQCDGSEGSLAECRKNNWTQHDCRPSEVAGVVCQVSKINYFLVNGTNAGEGRIEILINGVRGTVCDDGWDDEDASVFCKTIGFRYGGKALAKSAFGLGRGQIWLDKVDCQGNETSLMECSHRGLGVHDCSHAEDASVRCYTTFPNATASLHGWDEHSGTVKLLMKDEILLFRDTDWGIEESQVFCRWMGYKGPVARVIRNGFEYTQEKKARMIKNIDCSGSEASLLDCKQEKWKRYDYNASEIAGVVCQFSEVNYFLVNGTNTGEGRIEILLNGVLGTVCDDGWDDVDAGVFCKMMGFRYGGQALAKSAFGSGQGQIWLDEVNCQGHETSLTECSHRGWGDHNCGHNEDAAVLCYTRPPTKTTGTDFFTVALDGWTEHSGTVKVTYNGSTGVICDKYWDIKDAQVVCRMLGYRGAIQFFRQNAFDYPLEKAFFMLDNVQCNGTEGSLAECRKNNWKKHNCGSSDVAGVVCEISKVNFFLVNGSRAGEGRIEILLNGVRGTVCDDGWDDVDAGVFCKMMGFRYGGKALTKGAFGSGRGQIWLGNVNCQGNETSLMECSHRGWGVNDCSHSKDAGVRCTKPSSMTTSDEDVSLVGWADHSGTVTLNLKTFNTTLVFLTNTWGIKETQVVCRSMGYQGPFARVIWNGFEYSRKRNVFMVDNVKCNGSEASLMDCKRENWKIRSNEWSQIAGVVCQFSEVNYFLVSGTNHGEGRIEILINGVRGTVCDDGWDDRDAGVFCKTIGFRYGGKALSSSAFGRGQGQIWLDDLGCQGTETSLMECSHVGWGSHNCNHDEDAAVRCHTRPPTKTTTGKDFVLVSLVGWEEHSGTVMVTYDGSTGNICDDGWDIKDARVVCRMLGYRGTIASIQENGFGYPPDKAVFMLDNVECDGTERSLAECRKYNWTQHDCRPSKVAGVVCQMSKVNYFLVNGTTAGEGRIEILLNGLRGTVCDDDWDDVDAGVLCKMMGFRYGGQALSNGAFGTGLGQIWLDDIDCKGNETSLMDCGHNGWGVHNCNHNKDAAVRCYTSFRNKAIIEQDLVSITLVGWEEHSGTVTVTYNGSKGVVCDNNWDIKDAQVVCRMLGYRDAIAPVILDGFEYLPENDVVMLDNVECIGSETTLADCPKDIWTQQTCSVSRHAGVVCQLSKVNYFLVNGTNPGEGRIEILLNGVLGTVCDDDWDDVDAGVFCKMMGFSYGGQALSNSAFGAGRGQIWFDYVQCQGNETSLTECSHKGLGVNNCDHTEDAAVRCYISPPNTDIPTTATTTPIRTATIGEDVWLSLVDGSSPNEGTIQLTEYGIHFRICDEEWDDVAASVVCKMLGYTDSGIATKDSFFNLRDSTTMLLSNMKCVGNESTIMNCSFLTGIDKHECKVGQKAGVICHTFGGTTIKPPETQKLPTNSELAGLCGIRPYDYLDVFKSRHKRSSVMNSQDLFVDKIVGGALPWQGRVVVIKTGSVDGSVSSKHHCGAAIISEYWLLSAAHCFWRRHKSEFQIVVGEFSTNGTNIGEQTFDIAELITHPLNTVSNADYDIALIKIKIVNGRGIQFNNYVQPACLPDANTHLLPKTECLTSNSPTKMLANQSKETLNFVKVPLIDDTVCRYYHSRRGNKITPRMLCAEYTEGAADTCHSNSSPLVCNIKGLYTLVGLTSWEKYCEHPTAPVVYARVSEFVPWIDKTINYKSLRSEKELPLKPEVSY